jgi:small-conductance mechanosensitive channel
VLGELGRTLLNPATALGAVAYATVFLVLALIAARLVGLWSRRLSVHPRLFVDKTSAQFVAQLLRVGCFLVAALIYARLVPTLRELGTALLASAGVISLVVGLAAQQTLGQMIAGLAILFYRPFQLDDTLTVITSSGKEQSGVVKHFTLGYTRLEADDGRWIVVPNSVMLSAVVISGRPTKKPSPPG